MKKLLFCLFLSAIALVKAQNDDCTGAISLTVGTNFASGAITTNNNGATTDGSIPSCNPDAIENVWFKVEVPQSGNLRIKLKAASGSSFYTPVLTVYSGTCGALTEIECRENGFSQISLTGQNPGEILYISVWKYDSNTSNGEFQISVYDPVPPANDDCSQATPLTVGSDFASGVITSSNGGATTDGPVPFCQTDAIENVWFKTVVPQSGNLKVQIKPTPGSSFDAPVLSVYSGTCGSLTEIECNSNGFSQINLTGQTPGETLYISVWKYDSYTDSGEFQISAYAPAPLTNDDCSQATPLTVGTDFASGAITSTNNGATTDGSIPSCDPDAVENVWFKAVVPQSGNLKIEIKMASGSLFDTPVLTVYNGTCGSLTEIKCNYLGFLQTTLTGQNPGDTVYISVWKYNSYIDNGTFDISAYDPITPANDDCSQATPLTVGSDFASGVITSTNNGATTDGSVPSCGPNAVENVWFKAVVPQSGNLKIQIKSTPGSSFVAPILTAYSGTCGSLNEIECRNNGSLPISLTGQTPGNTVYISVWKYDSSVNNGEFQISVFDPVPPTNNNCSQAIPLAVGSDFTSGAITSTNNGATTDGSVPSCNNSASENVWFTVVVPPSGNLKIKTKKASGSNFDDSVLTVYSGICGSLNEIGCNDDDNQGSLSSVSLTGQTPGAKLYISVWKYAPYTDNGEFQISAYTDTALSTHETTDSKKNTEVYPNPFSDILTLSNTSDVTSVSITDVSGRLIKTIEKPSPSLHLKDLKTGLYFITLKMKDGSVKTIKTIKK